MRDPIEHIITSVILIMVLLSVDDEDDWEDDYSYDSQSLISEKKFKGKILEK